MEQPTGIDGAAPHIRLVMIVKNEAKVIERCLRSVKHVVSSWCVVDTGSTDDTIKRIEQEMRGIPGQVFERPWVQETANRNEALVFAENMGPCDYFFVIDADEVLHTSKDAAMPSGDAHSVVMVYGSVLYDRTALVSVTSHPRYVGTGKHAGIHPTLMPRWGVGYYAPPTRLAGWRVIPVPDGASWQDRRKYHKHAELLQRDHDDTPHDTRVMFYLAQSYKDAANFSAEDHSLVEAEELRRKALHYYRKRFAAGAAGHPEEQWHSLYESALREEELGQDPTPVLLKCLHLRPWRAEPAWRLARYYRIHRSDAGVDQRAMVSLALVYSRVAAGMTAPPDALFVDRTVYQWQALDELSMAEAHAGNKQAAAEIFNLLLARAPVVEQPRIRANMQALLGSV